uniref:Uncharacterized protein n=1 Tax=Sphaerodactylus townsendi TaxID=933632 RepID=A0ACB8FFM2_9SAUR
MMDPIQEAYGNTMGSLLFIPSLIADVFWFAAILASLGATMKVILDIQGYLAIIISACTVILYTLLGGLYSVAYTDVIQLVFIMASLWICVPFAMTNFATESIFYTIGRNVFQPPWVGKIEVWDIGRWLDDFLYLTGIKLTMAFRHPTTEATEKDVLWVMRVSMVAFGTLAGVLAFYSHSIYDLWLLGGELVYALLFPQLCCVLFIPNTNTYGSAAGFVFGLLLRLLAGEPSLKIPPFICYPGCSVVDGVYIQRFPFKMVTMLITLLTIISVSYLAAFAFKRNLLPHEWDICKLIKEDGVFISLPRREEQSNHVHEGEVANGS